MEVVSRAVSPANEIGGDARLILPDERRIKSEEAEHDGVVRLAPIAPSPALGFPQPNIWTTIAEVKRAAYQCTTARRSLHILSWQVSSTADCHGIDTNNIAARQTNLPGTSLRAP